MAEKHSPERAAIEAGQDGIGAFKKALRELEKINTAAGRHDAANAAMGIRGEAMALHSKAMALLTEHYPEFAADISTRGGGAR